MIKIDASGERCLCDFTFDFYWQHKGSRFNPDATLGGISFRKIVDALRCGETVAIKGDVGSRLGSSMGVDLVKFGGMGGPIDSTGRIVLDGDASSHMGISMLRGAIYASGKIEQPLGNVIEVESDMSGYRKYISITQVLECGIPVLKPNMLDERGLSICDGLLRDTVGARMDSERAIMLDGDTGMSTGILMRSGLIDVSGNASRNTGVLMKGGKIIIHGNAGDFTGAEMHGGEIFIEGSAGGYACAKMKGGSIYAKDGRPIPPAKAQMLKSAEMANVARILGLNQMYAMMYKRFSL